MPVMLVLSAKRTFSKSLKFQFSKLNKNLKDFESCNVEDSDEMMLFLFAGQGHVTSLNKPNEESIVNGFAQSSDRKENLKNFHIRKHLKVVEKR